MIIIMLTGACSIQAQKPGTTTIILVRHAEKEIIVGNNDPGLTSVGKLRATRLSTLFPNANPDEMYSTDFKRTRETLAPWAKTKNLEINIYDAAHQTELANQLKQQKGKTIVVAGHSNTIPALANLLTGSDKYTSWEDAVYNKLIVVTIYKGKAKAKVIEY